MLYREVIAVCSEIHTKHINRVCGQNVEGLNVKMVVHIVTTGLFFCLFTWASAASHGCTAACWLIVPPALEVPTLATRCPAPTDAFRTLAAEVRTYGRGIGPII
jgi:hypothetical protein